MPKRKIIKIDEEKCSGCGACVTKCAEGALQIVNGKAKVVNEVFCDGLGACIGECPEGALKIIERDAPEFDEEAVKRHISEDEMEHAEMRREHPACGCPGHDPIQLKMHGHKAAGRGEHRSEERPPELINWPIQWKLVQPSMPFFRGEEVLIAADCVPFAMRDFHGKYLAGRPVIIGCPKLDEQQAYLDKLTDVIKSSGLRAIQVVHMEVPCCFGLEKLVDEAVRRSGKKVPVKIAVVGIKGEVLKEA
jgi:ferredoxin